MAILSTIDLGVITRAHRFRIGGQVSKGICAVHGFAFPDVEAMKRNKHILSLFRVVKINLN